MTDALTDEELAWLHDLAPQDITLDKEQDEKLCVLLGTSEAQCVPVRLLATISALRAERDELAASVVQIIIEINGRDVECPICEGGTFDGAPVHVFNCLLENLPTAAKALMEELERLRANQRTPGTVEVCGNCRIEVGEPGFDCGDSQCPIRSAAKEG